MKMFKSQSSEGLSNKFHVSKRLLHIRLFLMDQRNDFVGFLQVELK